MTLGGWDVYTHLISPGSDWPFPMGASSAEYDLGILDDPLKLKIRKTNVEAVFGTHLH